jgi:hypothetical protein
MSRRSRPPYPDIDTPQTFAASTLFRSRWPQLPATPEAGIAERQIGERQQALARAPSGEPPIDVDVRSVYDVRPINAYDANIPLESDSFTYGGTTTPQVGEVITSVPLGYVFVLRQLDHYLRPEPGVTSRGEVLLTLTKNSAAVPQNVDVPVGADSQGLFRTFVVYDEGEQFGARVTVTLPSGSAAGSSVLGVNFYGNFVRKTGRPAPLEIGNPMRVRP